MKVIVASFLCFTLLTGCYQYTPPKTGLEGKSMPSVNLLMADSINYFNTDKIPEGQPSVVFYFNPQCPYCRAQMTEMTKKIDEFKNVNVYVMTISRFNSFKHFCNEFNLEKYPEITAGIDYTGSLAKYYEIYTRGVPFTAIYNTDKKLNSAFTGKISVSQIRKALDESARAN